MEAFKQAWFAIDVKAKLSISSDELEAYMRKNNYEEAFVQKWMTIFDQDNSGTIELEEFCDVLGLEVKEMEEETRQRAASGTGASTSKMPDGVEYLAGDMTEEMKIDIAKLCIEALQNTKAMKEVPGYVKKAADKRFDRIWHIIVVRGQFWCHFGYEPYRSFVFRYHKNIFITWKTDKL